MDQIQRFSRTGKVPARRRRLPTMALLLAIALAGCPQTDSSHNDSTDTGVPRDTGPGVDADVDTGVDAEVEPDAGDAWDNCTPIASRWLNADQALHTVADYLPAVSELVEDASRFEQLWTSYFVLAEVPPPVINFTAERVVWSAQWKSMQAGIGEPQIRWCDGVAVFRPVVVYEGGEYPSVVVSVAAIDASIDSVVFGDDIVTY